MSIVLRFSEEEGTIATLKTLLICRLLSICTFFFENYLKIKFLIHYNRFDNFVAFKELSRKLVKEIGPEFDKRDLKGIKLKIKVFRQKERTGFDQHFLKI